MSEPSGIRLWLPRNVIPEHYDLEYTQIDLVDDFGFSGRVRTLVKAAVTSSTVTMHCRDLEILSASVQAEASGDSEVSGRPGTSVTVRPDPESQMVDLDIPSPLEAGRRYTIEVTFRGTLETAMAGFYRSSSRRHDGSECMIACTMFEPTDARLAFPCWDEPSFLASFSLTLVGPADAVIASNIPVCVDTVLSGADAPRTKDGRVQRRVTFARLPRHPTYLYAWMIGGFDYLDQRGKDGVIYRVLTQYGDLAKGWHALQWSSRSMAWLAKFFGTPYQYPKMDLVAIPDFAAGAMENTGLVMYRRARILVDPKSTRTTAIQSVALTIAHENTHQWTGNTVVPYSFKYLWLNEAFATFVGPLVRGRP